MKPTPEQIEAAKAWTRSSPSSPYNAEQYAALEAYVEANKGVHGLWQWSDAPAFILLAALEAAEADGARLSVEALGFAFAWACTALDEGEDPREIEVPALMDAWSKAQALAARKAQP